MNVLWVTSFAKDMWDASGKNLLASFEKTRTEGKFFIGIEGLTDNEVRSKTTRVSTHNLDTDNYLRDSRETHRNYSTTSRRHTPDTRMYLSGRPI